jgi:hypothetical protein
MIPAVLFAQKKKKKRRRREFVYLWCETPNIFPFNRQKSIVSCCVATP